MLIRDIFPHGRDVIQVALFVVGLALRADSGANSQWLVAKVQGRGGVIEIRVLGRRSRRHRGQRSDFTALIWLCNHANIAFLEGRPVREQEMRMRVLRFLKIRMRNAILPATVGIGLAVGGCVKEPGVVLYMAPMPSDASAEVMPPGVPIYGAFFPDSAPNLNTDSIDAQASDGGSGLDTATDELIVY